MEQASHHLEAAQCIYYPLSNEYHQKHIKIGGVGLVLQQCRLKYLVVDELYYFLPIARAKEAIENKNPEGAINLKTAVTPTRTVKLA